MSDEIKALQQQDRDLNRARINRETAKIPWHELQRFFAQGKVMQVDKSLDLVDVALAMQQDDLDQVRIWTKQNQIHPVSDEQARTWVESKSVLWTVVVKPWVFTQECN